jgi:Flp pilus assembly pilin Flp
MNRASRRDCSDCAGGRIPLTTAVHAHAPLLRILGFPCTLKTRAESHSPGDKRMRRIRRFLGQLLTREDGPTAVEYAVVIAMVLLVCIGAVNSVGQAVSKSLQNSADLIGGNSGGSGSGSGTPGTGSGGSGGSGSGSAGSGGSGSGGSGSGSGSGGSGSGSGGGGRGGGGGGRGGGGRGRGS